MKTMMAIKPALLRLSLVLVLLGAGGVLAACENTIRGAGEDIRDSSDAITDQTQ